MSLNTATTVWLGIMAVVFVGFMVLKFKKKA